jgi:hypothetical protein
MEADLAAESQVRIISELTSFLPFHFVKQGGWKLSFTDLLQNSHLK